MFEWTIANELEHFPCSARWSKCTKLGDVSHVSLVDEAHRLIEGCAAKRSTHKPGHYYTPAQTVVCGPSREGARRRGKLDHDLIRHATQGACPVPKLRVLLYRREQSCPTLGKRDGCQRTVMPRVSSGSVDGVLGEGDSRKTARNPVMKCENHTQRKGERSSLYSRRERRRRETAGPRSQGVVCPFFFFTFIN